MMKTLEDWNYGLGLMSGTSLDGVDLALCAFKRDNKKWFFEIVKAETVPYDKKKYVLISALHDLSGLELLKADIELGRYYGYLCKKFMESCIEKPEFIASHGHTVFHNPAQGYTLQIGNSASIAAETLLPVVSDFRMLDVALGGQGAPLVPIGDELLFSDYDALINLGGFSNISYQSKCGRIAYDISPVNIALNYYAKKMGLEFDKDGNVAASGTLIDELLTKLNNIKYYEESYPKSLSREWFEQVFLKVVEPYENNNICDIMNTICYHVVDEIYKSASKNNSILFSGGGIKNKFLASLLMNRFGSKMIIPDEKIIDYKEALIFAFMGLLRLNELPNTLQTVTGAKRGVSAGMVVTM